MEDKVIRDRYATQKETRNPLLDIFCVQTEGVSMPIIERSRNGLKAERKGKYQATPGAGSRGPSRPILGRRALVGIMAQGLAIETEYGGWITRAGNMATSSSASRARQLRWHGGYCTSLTLPSGVWVAETRRRPLWARAKG